MTSRMAAFAQVARSDALRRAQLSFGLIWAGEGAVMVALGVVAFRDGGAAAVGLVTAVRMVPAAVMAPFAARLARGRRRWPSRDKQADTPPAQPTAVRRRARYAAIPAGPNIQVRKSGRRESTPVSSASLQIHRPTNRSKAM